MSTPTRRQFLRDCSIAATVVSLAPAAALAREPLVRRADPSRLVMAKFEAQLYSWFSLRSGTRTTRLQLVEVKRLPATMAEAADVRNERFSLRFRGPAHPALAQDTYALDHARLGRLDIFIVPMAVAQRSFQRVYEAVFNFPVQPEDVAAQLSAAPQPARRY